MPSASSSSGSNSSSGGLDVSQLRYPVVCWTGAPLHQISAVALAFPQPQLYDRSAARAAAATAASPSPDGRRAGSSPQADSASPESKCTDAAVATPASSSSFSACPSRHFPPHAFLLTGSQTGELGHWYIPSYRTGSSSSTAPGGSGGRIGAGASVDKKQCGSNYPIPRGLLLRQGAAACTAVCYCRAGMTQMFCAGTSEGFLSLWTVGGGRCVRSELALPFGPSQILFYQRYNPLVHRASATGARRFTSSPSPSPSPSPAPSSPAAPSVTPPYHSPPPPTAAAPVSSYGSPSPQPPFRSASFPSPPLPGSSSSFAAAGRPASAAHNYLLCCSDSSRDVYVVELPSLAVLATLQHRAPVACMALVPPSSATRTPLLVTVTTAHHICLWDLNQIERRREDKARVRAALRAQRAQAAQSRGGSGGSGSFTISLSTASGATAPLSLGGHSAAAASALSSPESPTTAAISAIPSNFSNPPSSLLSHSASIVQHVAGSSSAQTTSLATGAAAVSAAGVTVCWDDPAASFMLPLPPVSFTLSPLFTPVALALSPDARRGVVVFPYGFVCVDMERFELEGPLHSMAHYLRRSRRDSLPSASVVAALSATSSGAGTGLRARRASDGEEHVYAEEEEREEEGASGSSKVWNERDVSCIAQHAPWIGAGFLSVPSAAAASASGSASGAPPGAGAGAAATPSAQYLVIWNGSGEFIWIYSITPRGAENEPAAPSSASAAPAAPTTTGSPTLLPTGQRARPSLDELSLPGSPMKRSLSNSKFSMADRGTGGTGVSGVGGGLGLGAGRRASEAPESTATPGRRGGPMGKATLPPRVHLVAQCLLRDPQEDAARAAAVATAAAAAAAAAAASQQDVDETPALPHPPALSILPSAPAASSAGGPGSATSGAGAGAASVAVLLSGHTIYAGTDAGALFQWHVPVCGGAGAAAGVLAGAERGRPRVFLPSHVSRVSDAFPSPASAAAAAQGACADDGATSPSQMRSPSPSPPPPSTSTSTSTSSVHSSLSHTQSHGHGHGHGLQSDGSGGSSSGGGGLAIPKFLRAVSTPSTHAGEAEAAAAAAAASAMSLPRHGSPRSPLGGTGPASALGTASDPVCSSVLLVDPVHEALLLATGHRSGALNVSNVLSRASGRLGVEPRPHRGPVTAMLHLSGGAGGGGGSGAGEGGCLLATGGADGRVCIVEGSTGALLHVLPTPAPVLSLHRPSSLAEEGLGPHYRGANSALLFANCGDATLRCFSLQVLQEQAQAAAHSQSQSLVTSAAASASSSAEDSRPRTASSSSGSSCVFIGRGLDSPVRALFRPGWAVQSDQLVVQTRTGGVYLFGMGSSQLVAVFPPAAGEGAAFLQRHDLIAPGSQLAILAHRLAQVQARGLARRKLLGPGSSAGAAGSGVGGAREESPPGPLTAASVVAAAAAAVGRPLGRSPSKDALLQRENVGAFPMESAATMQEELGAAPSGPATSQLSLPLGGIHSALDGHVSGAGAAPANSLSYDAAAVAPPPPLRRARSTLPALRRTATLVGSGSAQSRRGGGLGGAGGAVDPSFQRSIYNLNQMHQAAEREEEEWKRTHVPSSAAAAPAGASGGGAAPGHSHSALNPPLPGASARPPAGLHHQPSVSSIIQPKGGSAPAGGTSAGPLRAAYVHSNAAATGAGTGASTGAGVGTGAGAGAGVSCPAADHNLHGDHHSAGGGGGTLRQLSPSPSPSPSPPSGAGRSPISCVDVVTSPGSSLSPLAHLHANVYVWNVHTIAGAFLGTHAAALGAMAKRAGILAASRADPSNAALAAQARVARAAPVPPAFYVVSGLLSTLFDWDSPFTPAPAAVGAALRSLRLYRPAPAACFGNLSDSSQALTLLFPSQAREHARWGWDADMSTRHLLAVSTVLTRLAEAAPLPAATAEATPALSAPISASAGPAPVAALCAPVLHYYQQGLPQSLSLYVEPDVSTLALFALNVHRPVHQSARLLAQRCIAGMPAAQRAALAEEKGRIYDYPLPAQRLLFQPEFNISPSDLAAAGHASVATLAAQGEGMGVVGEAEMLAAAVLCWIGAAERREKRRRAARVPRACSVQGRPPGPSGASPPPSTAAAAAPSEPMSEFTVKCQYILNTLLRLIAWPVTSEAEVVRCALACDLLNAGMASSFRHHITEPLLLLRRLYALSMHPHEGLARAAHAALLDAGKIAPSYFVQCVGREAANVRQSVAARQGALMALVALVKRHPASLARALPAAVATVVHCLDPSEPALRKTLLTASTSALYALAAHYPSVSFHQASQRFAVGTGASVSAGGAGNHSAVLVYDLRSATTFSRLDGHLGAGADVHAVSFHPKGTMLASYSATENPPSVRVWNTGGGGFLSGLLGMEGKCAHSWPMLPCQRTQQQQQQAQAGPAQARRAVSGAALSGPASALEEYDSDDDADLASPPVLSERDFDEPDPRYGRGGLAGSAPATRPSSASVGGVSSNSGNRFSVEELLSVKIMWIADKSLKLKREDGSMVDFSFA